MQTQAFPSRSGDGTLWLAAMGLSLLFNLLLLAAMGFTMLETAVFRKQRETVATLEVPQEAVATIVAEWGQSKTTSSPVLESERRFARTSDDQVAPPSENPLFIGERNTRATSESTPDAAAPPLPSQKGLDRDDLETTTSNYQDGSLNSPIKPLEPADSLEADSMPGSTVATDATQSGESAKPVEFIPPGADAVASTPPPQEKLLAGPNPVDVPVPKPAPEADMIKPASEQRPTPPAAAAQGESGIKPSSKPSRPVSDPAFSGNQRKSAIVGSITRSGRSALDVEDTPLGRYEAAISRAVEQEWQRNCMRHRDFITPGYLTVRFFVEPNGKVKSVQFVGDMETGEVQKGFTLNSIRDADIPPMPQAVKKDFAKDPLELIFRFYF